MKNMFCFKRISIKTANNEPKLFINETLASYPSFSFPLKNAKKKFVIVEKRTKKLNISNKSEVASLNWFRSDRNIINKNAKEAKIILAENISENICEDFSIRFGNSVVSSISIPKSAIRIKTEANV